MKVVSIEKNEMREKVDVPRSILAVDAVSLTMNSLKLALKDTQI